MGCAQSVKKSSEPAAAPAAAATDAAAPAASAPTAESTPTSKPETQGVPHVVILGAGFGGLYAAQALGEDVENGRVKITLIDSHSNFMIKACLQFILDHRKTAEQCTHELKDAKISSKIRQCFGYTATKIDTNGKTVDIAKGDEKETVSFDYLIVGTGVVSDPSSVPGLADTMLDICNPESPAKIRDAIQAVPDGGTVLVTTAAMPYKCPPVPFEYAFLVDEMLRKRGVRDSVSIIITSPMAPFPFGGPVPKKVFLAACEEKKIEFRAGIRPTKIRSDDHVVVFEPTEGGEATEVQFDALIGTYPQRAPDVVIDSGMCNPKGFVPVDLITMESKIPGVFCVGDSSHMMLPTEPPKPHPKSGIFAAIAGTNAGTMISALVAGDSADVAREKVSKTRQARCFAETGDGLGIMIEPKLLADDDGPAGFGCEGPTEEWGAAKMTWLAEVETELFGSSTFGKA